MSSKRESRSAVGPTATLEDRLAALVDCDLFLSFDLMPGASEQTRRVKVLNANWVAGEDGGDGRFEVSLVTEDDQQHTIAPSPASMAALIALTQADIILLWDPPNRTLIAANLVGKWLEVVPGSARVRRWSPE